jgi:hypothetical protein
VSTGVEHPGQVKGYALLSYVAPLKREKSALWAEIEQKLEPAAREFFQGPIFANNWYERCELHALMEAFRDATRGRAQDLRELGEMSARYQLHVIYRMFLKFATPAMVFGRAASVWSRQTTVGSFRVVESHDDHLMGELDDPDLPPGIPELIAGWADTIIAMLGRTPYPTTWERLGPRRWRFRVSWVAQ